MHRENRINHNAYSTWICQYHIVFAKDYRKKAVHRQLTADIGYVLRKLCEEDQVEIMGYLKVESMGKISRQYRRISEIRSWKMR